MRKQCSQNFDIVSQRNYEKIKRIATIERGELIYCFSCEELKYILNSSNPKVFDKPTEFTKEEKEKLLKFFNESECDKDSEDEEEYTKAITSKDTEPFIEKLAILDKAKKFKVSFRGNFGYGEEESVGNLLQYVKDHTSKFFESLDQDIPSELNFMEIQNKMKTSNVHEAAIEYYKNLYSFLEEFELLGSYANFEIPLDNKLEINIEINGRLQRFDISEYYDEERERLDLSYKNITSIKDTVFPPGLKTLKISANKITSLKNLPPSLTELDISVNKITSLEGLTPTLTKLNISDNKIESLEEEFPSSSLTYLDISRNQITSLKGSPQSLTYLQISHNKIKSLISPQGESLLSPSLIELRISGNQITSLQGLPTSLTHLEISSNQITSLKGLLPSLEVLHITNNQITSLGGLPQNLNLKELKISSNQIKTIERLPPSLIYLNISHNQITSLKGLPPNLVELHSLSNQIKSLISPQGKSLLPPSLKKLVISRNRIKSLEGLPPNLEYLEVYKNQIESLKGLPQSLIFLDISDNKLKLPVIVRLRNLRTFYT